MSSSVLPIDSSQKEAKPLLPGGERERKCERAKEAQREKKQEGKQKQKKAERRKPRKNPAEGRKRSRARESGKRLQSEDRKEKDPSDTPHEEGKETETLTLNPKRLRDRQTCVSISALGLLLLTDTCTDAYVSTLQRESTVRHLSPYLSLLYVNVCRV